MLAATQLKMPFYWNAATTTSSTDSASVYMYSMAGQLYMPRNTGLGPTGQHMYFPVSQEQAMTALYYAHSMGLAYSSAHPEQTAFCHALLRVSSSARCGQRTVPQWLHAKEV